ncbi:MAG: hypothetical protein A3G38_04680 [Omnitrophica WOR_2 bacterium RIFCSPLOWO2_12_FULL_51_8]|nr:MAG: hypothetical protein A3G38_04680 [Omnitrophica WOR_2 bacterium RIFCSPLOWO2_12_FULL_51_8]
MKKWDFRDVLLLLVLLMLAVNAFLSLRPRKLEAETFKLDDCITARPSEKPAAYLHVVSH